MGDNNINSVNNILSEERVTEMDGKYLTFWTDKQLFGVPISNVEQIIGLQEITEIPEFPHYAKGIISLRGSIIPVIDMRLRLSKLEQEYNLRTCIIVTNINGNNVGFIVDEVDEVTEIPENDITSPPKMGDDNIHSYLIGVGKLEDKIVLLMDTNKLLSDDIIDSVTV